jgi:hypothetical protein
MRVKDAGQRNGEAWAYHQTMLGPSRPVPYVGAHVRIAHFGGGYERGTVVAVFEEGRRLSVRGETGDTLEFVLSPATARFVAAGVSHGPRLELLGDPS